MSKSAVDQIVSIDQFVASIRAALREDEALRLNAGAVILDWVNASPRTAHVDGVITKKPNHAGYNKAVAEGLSSKEYVALLVLSKNCLPAYFTPVLISALANGNTCNKPAAIIAGEKARFVLW